VQSVLQLLLSSDVKLDVLRAALDGGVDLLQLRDKAVTTADRVRNFEPHQRLAAEYGVPVLVNDDVEAALAMGAAGVHLGADDEDAEVARARLGPQAFIGLSTHGADEVRAASSAATHLGLGACFSSTTKSDTRPLAHEELRRALDLARMPVFAIGGIDAESLEELAELGVRRVAVSAAILRAERPAVVAGRMRRRLERLRAPG